MFTIESAGDRVLIASRLGLMLVDSDARYDNSKIVYADGVFGLLRVLVDAVLFHACIRIQAVGGKVRLFA